MAEGKGAGGEAWRVLGLSLAQRGLLAQAERLLRRSLLATPGCAATHTALADVLLRQGRPDEAVFAYQGAIRIEPRERTAYAGLGAALEGLGRLAEAADTYRRAVHWQAAPCPELQYRLGGVLARMGRNEDAVGAYTAALEQAPDHVAAIRDLSALLHRLGRAAEARAVLGDAVFELGAARSIDLLEHWAQLLPDDPVAGHRLHAWRGQEAPARAGDAYVTWLFDHYADRFDEHLRQLGYRVPALIGVELTRVLGAGRGRLDVLDAGCGTGLCAPMLRPYARRLTGVDLSPRMVAKARARGGYDALIVAELTALLAGTPRAYDLIVAADTLVYFGPLADVVTAAARALRREGCLAFTVERADPQAAPAGWRLNQSGRYSHTGEYLERTLTAAGLRVGTMVAATLRQDGNEPVAGYVVVARRPAPGRRLGHPQDSGPGIG